MQEKGFLISQSQAYEKEMVKIEDLIRAFFYDISGNMSYRMSRNSEIREKRLLELMEKENRPIAFFIDDCHPFPENTLRDLRGLFERVRKRGAIFSVVLIGQPLLAEKLEKQTSEEFQIPIQKVPINFLRGRERLFLEWLLDTCTREDIKPTDLSSEEAMELFVSHFKTPLQITHYAELSLNEACKTGSKQIGRGIV